MEWWKAGGIPTIMWHWGAPTKGEGYNQSKMAIDMEKMFSNQHPENIAMWNDLRRIADHLTELRDAPVPVLWRPMHECDGNWFWYGKGGGPRTSGKLWRTMFDYFTKEQNSTTWSGCSATAANRSRLLRPRRASYDLAGGDGYGRGDRRRDLFRQGESGPRQ